MSTAQNNDGDHGEVVRGRGGISWAWLFPLVALGAAGWMYATHFMAQGPEISIRFTDAPGIEAGKTALIYRGVACGRVTQVHLDPSLKQAVVKVRLEHFASGLAVETSDFWIERPMLSIQGVSGITSLIQGNSIRARMGTGKRHYDFTGLDTSPVLSMDDTAVGVRLECDTMQPLERGAPVTFRGVRVGRVREQSLSPEGRPFIELEVEESKSHLLKTSSRFWLVPATAVTLGPGGIHVAFSGLDALIQGGVAFDDFGIPGAPLPSGASAPLLASEELARASGEPFTITFAAGRGFRAGQTRITHLGIPVGIVTGVRAVDGKVEVTAQFERKYDHLRRAGTTFTIIQPMISLQGITGLETIITGIVIECTPGPGAELRTQFTGTVPEKKEDILMAQSSSGRRFKLLSPGTGVSVGAPVLYRDVQIGAVLDKKLASGAQAVELTVGVRDEYARLVRDNSVFWEERGLRGSIGFINIRIQTATPLPIGGGGAVALATPDLSQPAAAPGTVFTLYDKPKSEWLKWNADTVRDRQMSPLKRKEGKR